MSLVASAVENGNCSLVLFEIQNTEYADDISGFRGIEMLSIVKIQPKGRMLAITSIILNFP